MEQNRIHRAPIWDDIVKVTDDMIRNVIGEGPVIVTAGFPCQDVSLINSNASGIHGPKSKLFFEILRIVDIIRRDARDDVYIILENSPVIVTKGLDTIVEELVEKRDFVLKWVKCAAEEVGAYHRRRRWFALAYSNTQETKRHVLEKLGSLAVKSSFAVEPQPRILERRTARIPCEKIKSMGNAIVPAQLLLALRLLSYENHENDDAEIGGGGVGYSRSPYWIRTHRQGGMVSQTKRTFTRGPRTRLVLEDGKIRIECEQWPTPWATRTTAERLRRSFGPSVVNAAFFCESGREMTQTTDFRAANALWHISVSFLAWLMGYPLDWVK
jgi:site-specific DNA-cytosine methylase